MTARINAGLAAANDTRRFIDGPGALEQLPAAFTAECGRTATALVIADGNTWDAAGEAALAVLRGAGVATAAPIVYPGTPMLEPDYAVIEELVARLRPLEVIPIAVGAGTLNDIVKRAAFELGRRYVCVPTAASVDGFASFGASIRRDGFKQTMECPAPVAIVADASVLLAAPYDLTAAGYADLASEITAGADWVLADQLGIEPIHHTSWGLIQPHLAEWLAGPEALRRGSAERVAAVFEGLTMNGFGMQAMASSRPASGAEHLFSHVWEMEHLEHEGRHVSHGFKVAIGTLATTALYEMLFALSQEEVAAAGEAALERRPTWQQREREVRAAFAGEPYLDAVIATARTKFVANADDARERLEFLAERWPDLVAAVRQRLWDYGRLRDAFLAAGVPTRPEEIGLTRARVARTVAKAQMIRTRYTVLDTIAELGLMERCADRLATCDAWESIRR